MGKRFFIVKPLTTMAAAWQERSPFPPPRWPGGVAGVTRTAVPDVRSKLNCSMREDRINTHATPEAARLVHATEGTADIQIFALTTENCRLDWSTRLRAWTDTRWPTLSEFEDLPCSPPLQRPMGAQTGMVNFRTGEFRFVFFVTSRPCRRRPHCFGC